jgi:hypothetical protein
MMTKSPLSGLTLPLLSSLLLLAPGLGCGGSSPSPSLDAGKMTDAGASTPDAAAEEVAYLGPTVGGAIPPVPISEADAQIDVTVVADNRCCNVMLALLDPTADEMSPVLSGNLPPLDVAGGLPLSHVNGRWQAAACLPVNVAIEYDFGFTVPFGLGPVDAAAVEIPDGAAPAMPPTDGERDDAGTSDAAPPADDTAPPPTTMTVRRYDPALPVVPDGKGGHRNVWGPVDDCASIGATTGMTQ